MMKVNVTEEGECDRESLVAHLHLSPALDTKLTHNETQELAVVVDKPFQSTSSPSTLSQGSLAVDSQQLRMYHISSIKHPGIHGLNYSIP